MAISNIHEIELYIHKQLIELESQESLNLRINDVLFNPTKTSTKQSTYSYSFSIPSTPNNDRILDYANNLSKLNKFKARYDCEVYADGELLFDGSLTVQKYSAKDKKYTCNLVNIKVNTLEEIFGEEKMTSLHWDVDFDGAETINDVNYDTNTKYYFPLVCYGAFQKRYVAADSVGATYTPKKNLDKYNKWWIESFYPSLNVVETMKRAYESKGYTVGGSVFSDSNFKQLYASCNLAQEQMPIYNLGNPKFGHVSLDLTWNNYHSYESTETAGRTHHRDRSEYSHADITGGLDQELKFPYEKMTYASSKGNQEEYNFDTITFWNMMDSINNPSGVTTTINSDSYMYDPNEQVIVIPADGWYKINLSATANLSGATGSRSALVQQWHKGMNTLGKTVLNYGELTREWITITGNNATFKDYMPLEIQLIRNYDENIELIKGKKNKRYNSGNPNETEVYEYEDLIANKVEWETEFPHQDLYGAKENPTKENELVTSTAIATRNELLEAYEIKYMDTTGGVSVGGGHRYGGKSSGQIGGTKYNSIGFMTKQGKVMPYDPAVSTAFICGFSTMSDGVVSVMKNGKSWSQLSAVDNHIMANVDGLELYNKNDESTIKIDTNYCKNTYKDAPNAMITVTNDYMNGELSCCVYLNKNDILELVAIQRDFEGQAYATSATCHLDITAMSERSEALLRADDGFGYYSTTEFPTKLNLFNFTNNETKISDWITNVQKAFNLEIITQGNYVEINTNKGIKKDITYAVDIDDRVNSNEAESEFISYPRSMAVKYKIDTDEYGFELTVPQEYINLDNWYDYGDSGYTVINLNDDSYETEKAETQTNFSYTYYMDFDFFQTTSGGDESSASTLIRIPVIEKSEYMAEGYGYDEAMKHDGYSFTQRFWYRNQLSQQYVWLSSVKADGSKEFINLTYPMNSWMNFNLSYKDTEQSIATMYFNIHPMLSSNFVTVDVYLNPREYRDIKNGALVHFASDLYYVSEVSGFDCVGTNLTKLKLIKKV